MSKNKKMARLPIIGLCVTLCIVPPLLSGCSQGLGGGHQLSQDDFKPKPMPPEALKAMNEARSHAGPPPNVGPNGPTTAPK